MDGSVTLHSPSVQTVHFRIICVLIVLHSGISKYCLCVDTSKLCFIYFEYFEKRNSFGNMKFPPELSISPGTDIRLTSRIVKECSSYVLIKSLDDTSSKVWRNDWTVEHRECPVNT